jgi:FKBP-type peptidyl-prolyl cis-trans isomerase SlyD
VSSEPIETGKFVEFTYTVTDTNGTVTEQSDVPISFVCGPGSGVVEKLETSLIGKAVGDVIEVELSPEEGFGDHDLNLTYTDDIGNVPEELRHVGAKVPMQNDDGDTRNFVVTSIEDGKLTVDGNHPYAGKTVHFELQIVTVRDATADDGPNSGSPKLH